MTEPTHDEPTQHEPTQHEPTVPEPDARTQVHAGPHDEGGTGGMATRELHAHEAEQHDRAQAPG